MKLIGLSALIFVAFTISNCSSSNSGSPLPVASQELAQDPTKPTQQVPEIDPLQAFVAWHSQTFNSAQASCEGLVQVELNSKPYPEGIIINEPEAKVLSQLRFRHDPEKSIIYTGVNEVLMYYQQYSYADVEMACATQINLQSIYPSPKNTEAADAVRLYVEKKNGSKEVVYFFKSYFYTVSDRGEVRFNGPNGTKDFRFRTTSLKVEELNDTPELTKQTLVVSSGRHIEALNWMVGIVGAEMTAENIAKFFENRSYFTTNLDTGRIFGASNSSQVPIVGLFETRIDFLSYPKLPRDWRLNDDGEGHYSQAVAASEMIHSFIGRFRKSSLETSTHVKLASMLIIEPNSLYVILSQPGFAKYRKMIFKSGLVDEESWPNMSKEDAQKVIQYLLAEIAEVIKKEAEDMRQSLVRSQELQQKQLDLAKESVELLGPQLIKMAKFSAQMAAMGKAYSKMDGDFGKAGENLEKAANDQIDKTVESANGLIEAYKNTVQKIMESKSYKDAYRFKYPMFQLDERAQAI